MEPDNNSFKTPNAPDTTELNTLPDSLPSNSPPPNSLPPDSQSHIPPTPLVTLKIEKHPCFAHHQQILQQTTDQPATTNQCPVSVKPFRPFTSLQDYIFTNILIRAHMGTTSINQLLSTYLPGHLSFNTHKDVFNIMDQASRVTPLVSSPFFLPILPTSHPFWLV